MGAELPVCASLQALAARASRLTLQADPARPCYSASFAGGPRRALASPRWASPPPLSPPPPPPPTGPCWAGVVSLQVVSLAAPEEQAAEVLRHACIDEGFFYGECIMTRVCAQVCVQLPGLPVLSCTSASSTAHQPHPSPPRLPCGSQGPWRARSAAGGHARRAARLLRAAAGAEAAHCGEPLLPVRALVRAAVWMLQPGCRGLGCVNN